MKTFCTSLLLLNVLLLQGCSDGFDPWHADPNTGRWYTQKQVAQGAELFALHCASCHGDRAQATPDWIKPDSNGHYPPPPLDGSAHAWHHPFPVLKQTIEQGIGGRMPGWRGTLSDEQMTAVIAWFQSLWPEQGYQLWQRRHEPN